MLHIHSNYFCIRKTYAGNLCTLITHQYHSQTKDTFLIHLIPNCIHLPISCLLQYCSTPHAKWYVFDFTAFLIEENKFNINLLFQLYHFESFIAAKLDMLSSGNKVCYQEH